MQKITFNNNPNPFFKALREKVEAHFKQNNIQTSGNWKLYFKSGIQVISALTFYTVLVFFNPGALASILLCILLGFNLAVLGFNIMHEGGHQSFSRHKWINTVSAYFLNLLGGNSTFWKIKHNVNHHTFTNIEGHDADIDIRPFMRVHENQPRYWIHRFQHFYWVILYGISYIAWIFFQDFQKYFTGKIAEGSPTKLTLKDHFIFWITKLFYVVLYLGLPMYIVGVIPALVGFIIVASVCGLFISVVFQLAHVVEETVFPQSHPESNKIENEWAIHQVSTTANFATKNKVISWFLGGLNFQVEHHLFPKISHVHYPKISEFVKETCKEFNVKYNEFPSMTKAFISHLQHIKKLGVA